jgi:YggT family protein
MQFLTLLRYGVFAVVFASALVAIAAWAVRTRQVNPFKPLGRTLRSVTEPFVRPVERMLLKHGGNPQNAAWWIFLVALGGGIAVIALANWLVSQTYMMSMATTSSRGLLRVMVYYAGQILVLALIVRVIGSWLGQFQFSPWMRPVYLLTDWLILPLRRIVPTMGGFDITPMIAWFLLQYVILPVILSFI